MTKSPGTKWPIWVSIVFTLLIADVVFRILDEVNSRINPESVLAETVFGWTIVNLLLATLSAIAAITIFLRKPIGLKLGVIALVGWILEGAVSIWLTESEAESSLVLGIVIGLVGSLAILFGILIERLLRSTAVQEFFGSVDLDRLVYLDEPPPPPTFTE